MKKLNEQRKEFMSSGEYRAFSVSNPNEFNQLERDICVALKNRASEVDICDKYGVTRHVLTIIKENNGLIFKGPLAGASPEMIEARKLYERQCNAKNIEPSPVKNWRILFETKELTVRSDINPEEIDECNSVFSGEKIKNVFVGKTEQLPLDFEKESSGLFEHGSSKHLESIRCDLKVDFLQMLCDYPRLAASLSSLANELINSNSGKFTVDYEFGKIKNILIEYKVNTRIDHADRKLKHKR